MHRTRTRTRPRTRARATGTAAALGLAALALAAPAAGAAVLWPTAKSDGSAGDQGVESIVVSANGRWAVFSSATDGLVPGDANGHRDVFLRDLQTGALRIVSKLRNAPANGNSDSGGNANGVGLDISADGRFVVFDSEATNLTTGAVDGNNADDVFRWDRETGDILLVSAKLGGGFANQASRGPRISGDGRTVVFQSGSTNLTSISPGGNTPQVYARDMKTRTTTFVSVASDGGAPQSFAERADISADGRYVVFSSDATDIVADDDKTKRDIFRRDLRQKKTGLVSRKDDDTASDGFSDVSSISGTGRYVAFETDGVLSPADTNGQRDVYVRDIQAGTTRLASLGDDDAQAPATAADRAWVSADGKRVAFHSDANGLTADDDNNVGDVFLRTLGAGTTVRASAADGVADAGDGAALPVLSGNGRFVAFLLGGAGKLNAGDTNDDQDGYVFRAGAASDAKAPKITFSGPDAVIAQDPSGIALVIVGAKRVRPDAARHVKVKAGQRIRVWDGAGNLVSRKRPG